MIDLTDNLECGNNTSRQLISCLVRKTSVVARNLNSHIGAIRHLLQDGNALMWFIELVIEGALFLYPLRKKATQCHKLFCVDRHALFQIKLVPMRQDMQCGIAERKRFIPQQFINVVVGDVCHINDSNCAFANHF